jgi:hypothetical protein
VAYENARHASHAIGATEFLVESMTRKLCVRQEMDLGEHDAADGGDEDIGISVKKTDIVDWLEDR